jgi:hypothetical protein
VSVKYNHSSALEIDNHADTHCFGSNFTPIYFTQKVCDVNGFSDSFKTIPNVPICTACTAYDDPETGDVIILEFPQGLWFGEKMDHSLINPNQCRAFGISLCDDPYDKHRPLEIHDPYTNIRVPLTFSHSIVSVLTRAPTENEIINCTRKISMCSDEEWDPSAPSPGDSSTNDTEHDRFIMTLNRLNDRPGYNFDDYYLSDISDALTDRSMLTHMISSIRVNSVKTSQLTSATRHSIVTPEALSNKWRIGLDTAKNTLKVTTQFGIRHATHPLKRRYRTDMVIHSHRRINSVFYSDTMFSKFKSINNNKCAQVFCNEDLVQVYPLPSKAHAGEALKDFIQDVGIPREIIVDGANELVGRGSEFQKVARHYHIKVHQTEAYTPRQNRAEYVIGELKRRWRNSLVNKNVPKRLWDYGIRYQAEIMSRIARGPEQRTG